MVVSSALNESLHATPGSAAEHRARVQHAIEERAALRTRELAAQVSPENEAKDRIQIWERLHELRLPRTAGHVLVKVIARQTRLTVHQVHEEQLRRASTLARSAVLPLQNDVTNMPEEPASL